MENKDKEAILNNIPLDEEGHREFFTKKEIYQVMESIASQNEELIKENEELKEHIGETKSLNNSYAEKIKRQNERIKLLEEEIDGEEAVSRDRAAAISQLQSTIDEKNKEADYWKQRCEAAEKLVQYPRIYQSDLHREYFNKWQQLKQLKPNP